MWKGQRGRRGAIARRGTSKQNTISTNTMSILRSSEPIIRISTEAAESTRPSAAALICRNFDAHGRGVLQQGHHSRLPRHGDVNWDVPHHIFDDLRGRLLNVIVVRVVGHRTGHRLEARHARSFWLAGRCLMLAGLRSHIRVHPDLSHTCTREEAVITSKPFIERRVRELRCIRIELE